MHFSEDQKIFLSKIYNHKNYNKVKSKLKSLFQKEKLKPSTAKDIKVSKGEELGR